MIIYLPMQKGIRTKINTDKLKAYQVNVKLPLPFCKMWKEVPMTDEMFEEMKNHANCQSK